MNAIDDIIKKASALKKSVVLPEGMDARVVTAACYLVDRGICKPVVLGTSEEIAAAEKQAGLSLSERGIEVIDFTAGDAELEKAYLEAWNAKESKKPAERQKIIDLAAAEKTLRTKRIYFGGVMVKLGRVDGLVAGSIASTGDMLRAAFHTLGTEKGVKTASSCFIMDLKRPTASGDGVVAFGDCAVIPDPTSEQLVDIALATAKTYRDLTGNEP
jgi:phosphate acetyltransferase